jgi:hypothetical protein
MLAACERGDYRRAAEEMLASKWVGRRAEELARMMRQGRGPHARLETQNLIVRTLTEGGLYLGGNLLREAFPFLGYLVGFHHLIF